MHLTGFLRKWGNDKSKVILKGTQMIKRGKFILSNRQYDIDFVSESVVAIDFIKKLPVRSICNNIGGEIYFRVPGADIEYDGTQIEEFDIGDVVYWRSPIGEEKFAIALFYGNTSYSNWQTPRASSPCVKIGEIISDIGDLKSIPSGEEVSLQLK